MVKIPKSINGEQLQNLRFQCFLVNAEILHEKQDVDGILLKNMWTYNIYTVEHIDLESRPWKGLDHWPFFESITRPLDIGFSWGFPPARVIGFCRAPTKNVGF